MNACQNNLCAKNKRPESYTYTPYDFTDCGKGKAVGMENRAAVARGWGGEEMTDYKGSGGNFGNNRNVLCLDCGGVRCVC